MNTVLIIFGGCIAIGASALTISAMLHRSWGPALAFGSMAFIFGAAAFLQWVKQ